MSSLNASLKTLDAGTIESYQALAAGTAFIWKDYATRNYINGEKDLHEYQI